MIPVLEVEINQCLNGTPPKKRIVCVYTMQFSTWLIPADIDQPQWGWLILSLAIFYEKRVHRPSIVYDQKSIKPDASLLE
jgi:hypothetical protein